ncbi:hypothetical protein L6164_018901 [Bauhinia variegata]|uniref:Uncharacterized protein n=1 Tax=Bauhinia variegata TaxID=167791 RepID=A0ACB9NDX1_BAUVA|nr:hypothetical protein L6164_018901 [Bauhinia variegata]
MASEANQSIENVGATGGWRGRIMALPRKFTGAILDVMLKLKKPGEVDPRKVIHLSNFSEDEIIDIAQKRLTTILIDGLISVMVCIFVYPFWARDDLHNLVLTNIEKLGNFLQGFVDEYFKTTEAAESKKALLQGYTSVFNSKQTEENLANFARWEPCHGPFKFRHPWQQYLKIGTLSRQYAYRIDALNGYLNSAKVQVPTKVDTIAPSIYYTYMLALAPFFCGFIADPARNQKQNTRAMMKMMRKETGKALEELSKSIKKMIPPSAAESHITKSKIAAMNLRAMLKTGLWEGSNLLDAIPAVTVASLLIDVVSCTEKLAESVKELATLAEFNNNDRKIAQEQQQLQPSACDNKPPHHVITVSQAPANQK